MSIWLSFVSLLNRDGITSLPNITHSVNFWFTITFISISNHCAVQYNSALGNTCDSRYSRYLFTYCLNIFSMYNPLVLFYKWLFKSISSVNILMDVPHTRDVRFSNSPPRDDNTAFLPISKWISIKNQQHNQLKVMSYILDPFDLWDFRKYKFHSHKHTWYMYMLF